MLFQPFFIRLQLTNPPLLFPAVLFKPIFVKLQFTNPLFLFLTMLLKPIFTGLQLRKCLIQLRKAMINIILCPFQKAGLPCQTLFS